MLIRNPTSAVGKQFIYLPKAADDERLPYKIAGVCVLEGGTTYLVQLIGCEGSVEMGCEEMERMFLSSVLVGWPVG
jgi:hypothetical protein